MGDGDEPTKENQNKLTKLKDLQQRKRNEGGEKSVRKRKLRMGDEATKENEY